MARILRKPDEIEYFRECTYCGCEFAYNIKDIKPFEEENFKHTINKIYPYHTKILEDETRNYYLNAKTVKCPLCESLVIVNLANKI